MSTRMDDVLNFLLDAVRDANTKDEARIYLTLCQSLNSQRDEPTKNLILFKDFGEKKINIIRIFRKYFNLTLKEAKTLVESAPFVVKMETPLGLDLILRDLTDDGAMVCPVDSVPVNVTEFKGEFRVGL